MIGQILNALLQECKVLLSDTGATTILKTDFKNTKLLTYTPPLILLSVQDAPESKMYPGGLTQMDWTWFFNAYNYEPDAFNDDQTGYSTDLINFVDQIREHFCMATTVVMASGIIQPGVTYLVNGSPLSYNGVLYQLGQSFVGVEDKPTYVPVSNGYVTYYGWLTQGMQDALIQYGFQLTFSGVTVAEALDQDGLIMGYKIGFESTAFDTSTENIASSLVPLTTITQTQEQIS